MHTQTHIMVGWCLANTVRMTPRQRLLAMLAAALSDLDGLGILVSQNLFWDYHHKLGHNLLFGLLLSAVLAVFSVPRARSTHPSLAPGCSRLAAMAFYLFLFHVHILMDLAGSGQGWTISYWWPFSNATWAVSWVWDFYSWQNLTAAGLALAWTVAIAVRCRRTPLEAIMPSLDRHLLAWLPKKTADADPALTVQTRDHNP
jgi:inner membrane protein